MQLEDLDKRGQAILASVKTSVVVNLLPLVAEYDAEAKKLIEGKRYSIQINASGGPTRYIRVSNGQVSAFLARKFMPTVGLWFPSSKAMNKMFSGKKAFLLPIPRSFKFIGALKCFSGLSARLSYYMGAGEEVMAEHKDFLTRLLLNASVFGISQVANHDPYVAADVKHIRDGIIEVYIKSDESIAGHIIKAGDQLISYRGRAPKRANVQLIFGDKETALQVLTGKINATIAMAKTNIKVKGNLSMMKSVFPILDRLSWYFSIK